MKIITLMATLVLTCTSFWASEAAFDKLEESQVRTVVNQHFLAIAKADRKGLEAVWATDSARITYTENKGTVINLPITKAFDTWTKAPAPDTRGTIQNIDVSDGRIATVKATVRWKSGTYYDYLTLMKVNGTWKLTGKSYVAAKKTIGGYGL